jgi:hypothetical protein
MADILIALKTEDTPRVQSIYDGFTSRGLTVFWSNDIQKGAPNYQAIIKEELLRAAAVVAVWTNRSVHCGPVIQEASQAERGKKLFQILIDDIEPIDMPMEVGYKSQKTVLRGWAGDPFDSEWVKLNDAIDARLGRRWRAPTAYHAPEERRQLEITSADRETAMRKADVRRRRELGLDRRKASQASDAATRDESSHQNGDTAEE